MAAPASGNGPAMRIPHGSLVADKGGGIGEHAPRPDGPLKVTGNFGYASDLRVPDMLEAVTVRSPHPSARITGIDVRAAAALPGVRAVQTHQDVPGAKTYGLDIPDQPVLAEDEVCYWGQPVAIVAAENLQIARAAARLVRVGYDVREPVTDPRIAVTDADRIVRFQPIRRGCPDTAQAPVVVSACYEMGMQDQAPLGPEAGLAEPIPGGVRIHVATQWLHSDRRQIASCLGLPEDRVEVVLAGVGGAFGAREDLSVQIHIAMLAMATGRPVRMVLPRNESFVGHPHRHPALLEYEHGADRDGRLRYVRARIILDGGAYTSSTTAVVGNAASLSVGPYEVPHIHVDCYGVRTNNPTAGAMRGFGAVQTCFAYESQMDALAARLGMDPIELRALNAVRQGSVIATGQSVEAPAPLAQMVRRARDLPAAADTTPPGWVRGVGYAVGIKNICFSEGFDDYSTARVRLELADGEPTVTVHTAAAEVGQGGTTIQAQIVRTELSVQRVVIARPDTTIGSAGSTSASRQSYMTGGAIKVACEEVRGQLLDQVASRSRQDRDGLALTDGKIVSATGEVIAALADAIGTAVYEVTREFHHKPTKPLDAATGQGRSHTQLAFCVHRATVDIDPELGQVRVAELAAVQDVGKIINRQSVEGQIQGGSVQGLGLALMEEIVVAGGVIQNPGFTGYLIPTALDVPSMPTDILECPDPDAPYGLRGVGEPPNLSATPAVVAAIRAASGRPARRVPVRPWDVIAEPAAADDTPRSANPYVVGGSADPPMTSPVLPSRQQRGPR